MLSTFPRLARFTGVAAASLLFVLLAHEPVQAAEASPAAYLQMAEDAAPLRRVADQFIAQALAGDAAAVHAMLSRNLVERIGNVSAERAVHTQILPFFAQGRGTTRGVTVTRTTDAAGSQGYAFYLWLAPAAGGEPRPFAVYVVQEQGRAVVANVVPDRYVPGRHL